MSTSPLPADALPALDVIDRAAAVIAVPKAASPNSFVLHAPLELMARVGLLPFVPAERRADALAMIDWLREQYEAAGDPIDPGEPLPAVEGVEFEAIVTSLAAAGHAPIGLALLPRVEPALPASLLRGALLEIARRPDWRVRWHLGVEGDGDAARLHEAVRSAPMLGRPGSDFIFPLMSQVQDGGLAAELLRPVLAHRYDVAAASASLIRIATWSMLHDDPSQAPYGWSHALTMPQGVMALAGRGVTPRTALAVAATFTLGFRVAHGTVELPDTIEPGPAADATIAELALGASLHEDAHLVKYTLACIHAAADDPSHANLHLRGAQYLAEWWTHQPKA